MPLKRAARGLLPLMEAANAELRTADAQAAEVDAETELVRRAKKISLFTLGVAHQKHAAELEKQQEVVMSLSDLFMETFAMESTLLRSRKLAAAGNASAGDICAVFLRDAIARMQSTSQNVLAACSEGSDLERDDLVHNMARLRSYANFTPVNAIAMRRNIAERLLSSERYPY
jgi:hypothetical protein